jgi:hypothetical protein
MDYFITNNILSKSQFGFRKNVSIFLNLGMQILVNNFIRIVTFYANTRLIYKNHIHHYVEWIDWKLSTYAFPDI